MWQAKESGIVAHFVAFEDLTKDAQWLKVNSLIGPKTALIMENVSRYPKITSEKVLYLQRLTMQLTHKCVIDIVPFTLSIEYLYTPYSYLDRSVLGFAHWYAFREGYKELNDKGEIVSSHDHFTLAKKVTGITKFGTDTIVRNRTVLHFESTSEEQKEYKKIRDGLFAEQVNPVKIITQLSDLAHAFDSLKRKVVEVVAANPDKKILILTNLSSYAKKYTSKFKSDKVVGDSFQVASSRTDLATFDIIIFAENPIVNTYFCLDIEAQCKRTAELFILCSDIKVCQYLFAKYQGETTAIASFSDVLRQVGSL